MKPSHIFSLIAPLLVTFGQFSNALLVLLFNLRWVNKFAGPEKYTVKICLAALF
jgi:hypothetical protein